MDRFRYSSHWDEPAGDDAKRRLAAALFPSLGRESHTHSEPSATATPLPLEATMISAVPLTHGELKAMVESLQQKYKRPIRAEAKVDGGFSGRVRVEIDGDVWIASHRTGVESTKWPRLHADVDSSMNAPLFQRRGNGAEARPAERDSSVPAERSMQLGKAVVVPPIPTLDRYECLQSNLWVCYPATSTKIMLLVGAEKQCGVSTVAVNLAASLAKDPFARILLVDANVRSAKKCVRVPPSPAFGDEVSLSRLLTDAPVLREPLPGPSNLYVLPSGGPRALPLTAFQSRGLDALFRRARELFEYVIIDAPSLPEHPETLLLIREVDGVMLVVESEKTRRQSALWAKRQIEKAGVPLLGVILNRRKYRVPTWLYKRI